MTSKGYSCFPVDAHFWLTLIFICLPPYTAQMPLALVLSYPWCLAETPTLSTQLRVGGAGLDEVKERRGQLGQTVWEDRTEEEVLGLRTLSCLVFQGFEELTHNTPCRRLELVMG